MENNSNQKDFRKFLENNLNESKNYIINENKEIPKGFIPHAFIRDKLKMWCISNGYSYDRLLGDDLFD